MLLWIFLFVFGLILRVVEEWNKRTLRHFAMVFLYAGLVFVIMFV